MESNNEKYLYGYTLQQQRKKKQLKKKHSVK